jgi:hypothetical protein
MFDGRAAVTARAPPPTSTERRLSWVLAISRNDGSVLWLGLGRLQALSHFRWQVTALRFAWV